MANEVLILNTIVVAVNTFVIFIAFKVMEGGRSY
jgi:hypothetical protein